MRIRSLLLISLTSLLVFTGLGCQGQSADVTAKSQPITLKYWRVFDGEDAFDQTFTDYRVAHPNVSFDYRKLTSTEYEKELLNALAEDNGPDIFSIHNSAMTEWKPRLLAVPANLSVAFQEVQGSIQKKLVYVIHNVPGITTKQIANDYVSTVADDVVIPTEQTDPRAPLVNQVYGLPLSVDTLALYYNRDLLNAAGIAQPAKTWKEFQDQVKKLTKLDETGAIIQSGTSLGTTANIERPMDILALLMMQNGAQMTDQNGMASFDKIPTALAGRPLPPGAEALVFYTDFANPRKEVYSWNSNMPSSLEAFVQGKTAYFIGYSYELPIIRAQNAKLNFGTAALPQIEGNQAVNYANYWVEVVSKKTKHPDEAWDFVQFEAAAAEARNYLNATKKPTALRSLINSQLDDLDLSVFAAQVPAAKSWYHGNDDSAAEQVFIDMITQMLQASADPKKIVELGATKVNQTIR